MSKALTPTPALITIWTTARLGFRIVVPAAFRTSRVNFVVIFRNTLASSHLVLSTRSGNEIGNGFIVLINGAVQYGIAPSILIPQLLNSHKIGELWDCNEKRCRFFGPQVIHNKLDDLSWQME
ncbi:hypothetical protein AFUB_081620 [Aspergillus fumigatus A1163]|uniref:Uncharacterized protein n=1 Tax=Aspergillus fumigatus (strain CBS 144.89 / FGSC A1163 / CEA10) TaxID=451804 RepID=B0Y9M7_ASPFC|nr:hypothetical protein AFUB_081620 [Aspergillus fumigatus A1163]